MLTVRYRSSAQALACLGQLRETLRVKQLLFLNYRDDSHKVYLL